LGLLGHGGTLPIFRGAPSKDSEIPARPNEPRLCPN
jgi:hypothetical protein